MNRTITTPLTKEVIAELKAGDYVKISGVLYTARDAAHKRMTESLEKGEALPINIEDIVVYYMGPSPAREGRPIDLPDPLPQAVWISILPGFWIWD